MRRFRYLLVPFHGDPSRQALLARACRLAKQNGALAKLIDIVEDLPWSEPKCVVSPSVICRRQDVSVFGVSEAGFAHLRGAEQAASQFLSLSNR